MIASLISQMHCTFLIKDLGRLNYFIGLEFSYTPNGLFLSQSKYASHIFFHAQLHESKSLATPMIPGQQL